MIDRRRRSPWLVLAMAVATVAGSAPAAHAATQVSAFPSPGTATAGTRTEVSLRGLAKDRLGQVLVVGSRSGKHGGELRAHSDGRGASFVPDHRFRPGERVTVRTGLSVRNARDGDFRFKVAHERNRAKPIGEEPDVPGGTGEIDRFKTRPDLRPQSVSITQPPTGTAPGDIFIAPKGDPGQDGPLIVDDAGDVVWFQPAGDGRRATDFRVQQYRGRPVLTWWQGRVGFGNGAGEGIVLNSNYERVARVRAGNGYAADLHDFTLTPQGTALVTVYQPVRRDLRSVGGSRNALVIDNVVQEIDIRTGLVVYEWHSIGHIALKESVVPLPGSPNVPWDYFHLNSVDTDGEGRLLVSGRNTSAVYELSRTTGAVLWRLGGRRSDFRMGRGTRFAYQHDARRAADGTLTIYDNAASPPVRKHSRAIRIALDHKAKRASLVRALTHPRGLLSANQGGLQDLPNGDTFVGWGSQPYFSEFSPDGRLIFEGRIAAGADNYRAYRFLWTGRPKSAPVAAVERGAVYASWNGATGVASWQVLAGASRDALAPVATSVRTGFETAIPVPAGAAFYAVRALDAAGAQLGVSRAVKP